jgi:hypothetical protein
MVDVPKKVKIGPQVFSIIQRSSKDDGMLNDGSYGYTLDSQNLIVIDGSLDVSKKKSVLMHEVLHAVRMVYDPSVKPTEKDDYESWEHHFINIYETGLTLLMQDNPKLVEWLSEKTS